MYRGVCGAAQVNTRFDDVHHHDGLDAIVHEYVATIIRCSSRPGTLEGVATGGCKFSHLIGVSQRRIHQQAVIR